MGPHGNGVWGPAEGKTCKSLEFSQDLTNRGPKVLMSQTPYRKVKAECHDCTALWPIKPGDPRDNNKYSYRNLRRKPKQPLKDL